MFSLLLAANWCLVPFLNVTSKIFPLWQGTTLAISHPCIYTLRSASVFAANGTRPISPHLRKGPWVISSPCGTILSSLSNCYSLCMSIYRQTRTLQKWGQRTTPGLLQETKQNEVMEKWRLSAGLQSSLAWHDICSVMTVNSALELTESLCGINCVPDLVLCVCLTL